MKITKNCLVFLFSCQKISALQSGHLHSFEGICLILTHYSKSQIFVQEFKKKILTIFLVKSKLSTAKKSKTTTFSRVFHQKKIDNFLGKSKLIFWAKNENFEQCRLPSFWRENSNILTLVYSKIWREN